MDAKENEKRLGWLAYTLDEGMRLGVFSPSDLLLHATPEVLAEHLPRELMVKVFASAFSTGRLTPEGILAVAPPSTLVRHVASVVLWGCVREAAHRGGIDAPSDLVRGKAPLRVWLGHVMGGGIERGIFTPADALRHMPPRDWVRDMPIDLVARLIAAGLTRSNFDSSLALEVICPDALAENVAPHLIWKLLDESAARAFGFGLDGGHLQAGDAPTARLTPPSPN